LNTVSAIGLLSVGIIGAPIIGAFNDNHTKNNVEQVSTEIYEATKKDANLFGVKYEAIDAAKADELAVVADLTKEVTDAKTKSGRQSLMTVALAFPMVMGIAFLLIGMWFKSRGGYKAVDIVSGDSAN